VLATGIAHTILATYNGDENYIGSSATSVINVTVGSPDFTFTATGPTYATVIPGSSVNFTYQISRLYGDYPDT
jgi:large repetitive protein